MLKRFVRMFGGDPNKRELDKYTAIVEQINALEPQFEALSNEQLGGKTAEFRARLQEGETLDDILPEAFAAVREASKRTLGMRHYDVQMIGGMALHQGKIAEMRTGEGKTLVATLPIYLNAITSKGVHLITVNDYLARRDARWKAPIYNALGLTVGVLQMAARTENGKKAFLVDLEKASPHEDQHHLRMVDRREAYGADITYGTNSEFGFDYLRDNMTMSLEERVQRGHFYAIVDEVDNVLIDEARTPLIISGPAQDDTEWYVRMSQVIRRLRPEDYEISERDRNITLTEIGETHVEELLEMPLRDPERPEDVTPEQARVLGYLEQALRAQFLFRRNKDYLVQAGKVVIIDEFTGRLMPGRRWSDGLHQAVEAKEGVRVQAENVTYATITIQNYFRMYEKLAGMTGTALTEAEEFDKIYKLGVLAIPTNLEYQANRDDTPLIEVEDRDELGYKYQYYTREDDQEKKPLYWRRKDYPDVIFLTEEAKFRYIVQDILANFAKGRPLLVGTTSVELSDRLSLRLRAEPLRRLAQVLLIRHAWFEKNKREEDGRQVTELTPLYAPLDQLPIADLRKMATSVDLTFNPEDEANLRRLESILGLEEQHRERLLSALKAGIPNQVLNARKHTEESQIIAGAGAFGAVTIATNMAGRGVDIKLGGELAEELISTVNRVLHRAGHEDPYNMTLEERRQALLKLSSDDFGIYDSEINFFLQHLQEMESVKTLGGLHVIGSERHEARRIDNQLRGRAARQGDPGSSRFYLSLEDDLMRRFGGQQANDMMQRLRVDEAMPIELGLVGRLVEQSQTRVEGANFDIRKHLLEYDDVLNTQRSKIYAQRNRIFVKEDLSDDVHDMLRTEVTQRVPKALKDNEGPWALLAWLDQIQPPIGMNGHLVPSYTLQLLVDYVQQQVEDGSQDEMQALLSVAKGALEADKLHLLKSLDTLLIQFQERLESQLAERRDLLDTFIEGLRLADETDTRQPRELAAELESQLQLPLRLSPEQQRALRSDPNQIIDDLQEQMENLLATQAANRLLGAIERRMGEELDLPPSQLPVGDWDTLSDQIYEHVEDLLDKRQERLLGSDTGEGLVVKDLENALGREKIVLTDRDKEQMRHTLRLALSEGGQVEHIAPYLRPVMARLEGAVSEDDRERIIHQVEAALSAQPAGTEQENLRTAMQALETVIEGLEEQYETSRITRMLMLMPVGSQTSFDRKTHRRIQTRTIRFTYNHFAAHMLDNREDEEIAAEVLEHLEQAHAAIRTAWGRARWKQLSTAAPAELDERVQNGFRQQLGDEVYEQTASQPLAEIPAIYKDQVVEELGRQALTQVYRQLLLGVITELWVEYLTEMEALRVSVGLEAYAQRDPLVQYKSRAFEMYQTLLSNMRLGVINRMFTYRPRDMSSMQAAGRRTRELDEHQAELEADIAEETAANGDAEEAAVETAPGSSPAEPAVRPPAAGTQKKQGQPNVSKSQKRRRGRR